MGAETNCAAEERKGVNRVFYVVVAVLLFLVLGFVLFGLVCCGPAPAPQMTMHELTMVCNLRFEDWCMSNPSQTKPFDYPTYGSFSCADVLGGRKCDNAGSQAQKIDERKGTDVVVPDDVDSWSANFEISPSDLYSQIMGGEEPVKLIDVRSVYEYKVQHLKDAVIVPLENLNTVELDNAGITRGDKIVVYCNAGVLSAKAYRILVSLGYTNVKSMAGGIVEWTNTGFPTEA